jgi:hypothetical protein
VSFNVLIALAAVHVAAILFYLFMLSGRKRVGSETSGMQRAPGWRLWTGAALAALVVWGIIKG